MRGCVNSKSQSCGWSGDGIFLIRHKLPLCAGLIILGPNCGCHLTSPQLLFVLWQRCFLCSSCSVPAYLDSDKDRSGCYPGLSWNLPLIYRTLPYHRFARCSAGEYRASLSLWSLEQKAIYCRQDRFPCQDSTKGLYVYIIPKLYGKIDTGVRQSLLWDYHYCETIADMRLSFVWHF